MADDMVTLVIYEDCRYTVTGATVYEAMRAFLDDPIRYLSETDHREVFRQAPPTFRKVSLTADESAEIERAENDS
jgi:hypothetical protein